MSQSTMDRRTFAAGLGPAAVTLACGSGLPDRRVVATGASPAPSGVQMISEAFDVLVIGGGPAGLSAALYLGRARKSVVVLDRGSPRHAVSAGVHNFLTREGIAPAELRAVAWQQMAKYPTVSQRAVTVASLEREGDRWVARTDDGAKLTGRAVLLATGVIDEHPDLPGFTERWGRSIHHCPYCHGWEMRDLPLAVLAAGEAAGHLAPLLRGWSDDVVLLTHGAPIDDAVRARLGALGVPVYDAPIATLKGPGDRLASIELADGTALAREGLFVAAPQRQVPLVETLGLDLTEQGYVRVDPVGATSLPMLWAAGDLTSRLQQVLEAAAQGGRAGAMMNAVLTLG